MSNEPFQSAENAMEGQGDDLVFEPAWSPAETSEPAAAPTTPLEQSDSNTDKAVAVEPRQGWRVRGAIDEPVQALTVNAVVEAVDEPEVMAEANPLRVQFTNLAGISAKHDHERHAGMAQALASLQPWTELVSMGVEQTFVEPPTTPLQAEPESAELPRKERTVPWSGIFSGALLSFAAGRRTLVAFRGHLTGAMTTSLSTASARARINTKRLTRVSVLLAGGGAVAILASSGSASVALKHGTGSTPGQVVAAIPSNSSGDEPPTVPPQGSTASAGAAPSGSGPAVGAPAAAASSAASTANSSQGSSSGASSGSTTSNPVAPPAPPAPPTSPPTAAPTPPPPVQQSAVANGTLSVYSQYAQCNIASGFSAASVEPNAPDNNTRTCGYTFNVASAGAISVSLDGQGTYQQYCIYLFGASGNQLAQSGCGTGGTSATLNVNTHSLAQTTGKFSVMIEAAQQKTGFSLQVQHF